MSSRAHPESRWPLRTVSEGLAKQYRAEGWWTDDTLGTVAARGLADHGGVRFRVNSKVRPWSGTFAEVERAARSLAACLQARGVGPGDVIAFQLPNWVEAAITFWAATFVGAVVVPIVHIYGAKEVEYILRVTEPDVFITADRFGRAQYLTTYEDLLKRLPVPLWLVVGETPDGALPEAATGFNRMLDAVPLSELLLTDPDTPALVAFTSGTTRDPKGVIHSHRTIGYETRQLDCLNRGGPPSLTGAPVGHFMGMLNALLTPLLRSQPVNLIDVWDPAEVLRIMTRDQIGSSGGATFFLTSLLDHPDFTSEHLALMPHAGLGGSTVPVAFTERASQLGIEVFRSYGSTEHPSMTGSLITDPTHKKLTTDGRALPGVELRLVDGEILSRGPDCFLGYTDTHLTANVFDTEGWYHTGDVGVLDDEGFLTITDRISDVIIRGGENISAQEVEELLLGLGPVAEVSVVGYPDDRFGERAAAVMRLHPGTPMPTLDEVRNYLAAAGLARQKWPEALHETTEFPRTPSGKVQKFRLRQQLREKS